MEKRCTILNIFGDPWSEAQSPPSQLCAFQVEKLWILGQRYHFWSHVLSYFWHVILPPFSQLRGCKNMLSTGAKIVSLQ